MCRALVQCFSWELPTPRSLGSTKPTMAVPVAPASVDSPRLKQGEALQQVPRCPAASGCRGGGCGQGGHEWTVGRGEAWLALARLQINSSPAASQPRGGRENSFHTVFADFFFFHSAASKSIPNRLSDCLDFRGEVARLWAGLSSGDILPSSF